MRKFIYPMFLILMVIMMTGCGHVAMFGPKSTYDIAISKTTYDNAFRKTLFVFSELGYTVKGDKDTGTFNANIVTAGGLGTTTSIDGLLTSFDVNQHKLKLKIKSSRGDRSIVEEFLSKFSQFAQAKIVQV